MDGTMGFAKFNSCCGCFVSSFLLVLWFCLPSILCLSNSNIITSTQNITDPETMVSPNSIFKLGFFSPENSTNRYVGIWYNNMSELTVVWVANREKPLTDSSGTVMIANNGNLVVLDGQKTVIWSTSASNISQNSSAQLLDSGNLVLQQGISNDGNNTVSGGILWQSFLHPSDTFLPNMKLGTNVKTGEKQLLTAWKDQSNPSIGTFSAAVVPLNIPQVFIWNGSSPYWRSGPWNNRIFLGVPDMQSVYLDGFNLDSDSKVGRAYLSFSFVSDPLFARFVMDPEGKLVEYRWDEENNNWFIKWSAPNTECDIYGNCGPFGSCNALDSPICSCSEGFTPKSTEEWGKGNWSGGCVRRTQLQCERSNSTGEVGKADGFLKVNMMKVPDFADWSAAADIKQCEEQCLSNCSCTAYAFDINIGCMYWSGSLIDMQKFSSGGVDLYIRLAYSEFGRKDSKVIIITTVVIGTAIIGVITYFSWMWTAKLRGRKKMKKNMDLGEVSTDLSDVGMLEDGIMTSKRRELPAFELEDLAKATNYFDTANKLGEGGFGIVYKGTLLDGQEIAVKKLSKSSGQGVEEFKNEVMVISQLQHRNLVRLLGCCIHGEEKMLIYEYMANKSLDAILFDPTKRTLLDWKKRFHIIEGIGRGLLYLHRDSRLKIIHRDLKASNVLLDEELNPKISDFGMARIFGGSQDEANTKRVVGTYGYMSPEYAMEGRFSEKSDVFSFGILLLEIVSGRKNNSFFQEEAPSNLLGHVWKLWSEGTILEMIDPALLEPSIQVEVMTCIHVGLLCVQEFAKDRPTMSSVMSMLSCEIATLPTPKQPGFIQRQITSDTESSSRNHNIFSVNDVSITICQAR
ncbi:PREDICTED: G-type lectin S-receptor-like serine/threonine-protein kinase At1g11330 [Nelumbo nucifera]|uniref:Receptor-like serine/threonine-protein kinase n=2 Tax=Nelumbo nucifera TaxID=4432 RepID=A0A1U8B0A1_NELNU|nr:PREDICTED: G-type lectin S-receptor-like serine/threonine-protein kinase At1g11330 [Nelumbo nucifera]DAD23138.1 TPA_asm: hypothetical protein HUJ06_024601 [Nelumbo nucifera]